MNVKTSFAARQFEWRHWAQFPEQSSSWLSKRCLQFSLSLSSSLLVRAVQATTTALSVCCIMLEGWCTGWGNTRHRVRYNEHQFCHLQHTQPKQVSADIQLETTNIISNKTMKMFKIGLQVFE